MTSNKMEIKYKKALKKIIAIEKRWKIDSDGTNAWGEALEIAKEALKK